MTSMDTDFLRLNLPVARGSPFFTLTEGKTRYLSEFEKSKHQEIRIQAETRKDSKRSSHADVRNRAVADYDHSINYLCELIQ